MRQIITILVEVAALVVGALVLAALLLMLGASVASAEPLVKYEVRPATEGTFDQAAQEVYGITDNGDGTSTLSINACGSLVNATFKRKPLPSKEVQDQVILSLEKKMKDCCEDPKKCTGSN